jgi:hypothetical protein
LFFSKGDKEEGEAPKGFEKFIKKTRDRPKREDKDKDDKKEAASAAESGSESEGSKPTGRKTKKSDSKKDSKEESSSSGFPSFSPPPFKNDNYTFWAAAALGLGSVFYLTGLFNSNLNQKEVTYMEFVNNYLTKNVVQMITVYQDKTNEMF